MTNSRRDFLRSLGATAIGLAAAPAIFTQRRARTCVVIGAGFAGLAAAYKLKNSGWNVTVLEARDRIGGRVFSHKFAGTNLICELGAEWVGESHERIKALCHDFGIPLQKHQFDDYLLRDGRVYRPGQWGFSAKAKSAFEKLIAGYEKLTPLAKTRLDKYDWWTYLEKIGFTLDDLQLRDLMDSTDFGESIRHVSAFAALAEYAESSPHDEMDYKMTGGNSRLAEELARRIGSEKIHLQTIVRGVRQNSREIRLATYLTSPDPNGYVIDVEFSADAVICTVPINSLLKIKFDPPLPPAQHDAAERLTYARICKNSVLYDERFWPGENFSMVSDVTSHYYFHSTQGQAGRQGILTSYAIGERPMFSHLSRMTGECGSSRTISWTSMRTLRSLPAASPHTRGSEMNSLTARMRSTNLVNGSAFGRCLPGRMERCYSRANTWRTGKALWKGAIETGEAAAQNLIR
jgi:monoamine oxidase